MCVRIDSYESPEHQKYVRTFLNGRFENSAFCLLDPSGQDWLTKAGRGPQMVIGRSTSQSVSRMESVAALYPVRQAAGEAIVPDFHSVRQALNVASADQRILVLMHGSPTELKPLRNSFRSVSNHENVIGRFHFDFESADEWKKQVTNVPEDGAILLIRPGEFGLKGDVIKSLPLASDNAVIVESLVAANREFAKTTDKKVYSTHVSKGRDLGIYFEGAVPYGEDRDGDGQVDQGRGGGGPRSGSSRSGASRSGSRRPR